MIGPKKLSAIREELHTALAATSDDPLAWLEQRMAAPSGQGLAASGESEILHSLRRFLAAAGREKRRKKPVETKK